jgi:type II secretory ATPase GspE/PulE/Tfp pilus assembly ATPase PilB-like protein
VLEIEPTPECPTGTKGRLAVFEAFQMDSEIEKMILKDPTETGMFDILRKKGMMTMREDAMVKAFKGQIPFEEVNSLTNAFEI